VISLEPAELQLQRSSLVWLQRTQAFALFAFSAFVCFSIAGSHISLGLLTLCVLLQTFSARQRFVALALGWEAPLALFVALCLISTILSDLPWASFRNLKNLLTILGAYTVAYSLRTHPEWRKPALWIFIATATGAALWGLIKFGLGLTEKVMSTQSTTMTWGAMSAMFILITLFAASQWPTPRERWAACAFFIPQLAALFFSLVRGAYLGFGAGVFYLFHRYWKRLVPAALVLLFMGGLFAPAIVRERFTSMIDLQHPTILVRLNQWKIATQIIADHPFFGVGWHDLAGLTREYAQPDPSLPAAVNHDVFTIGHYHSTYFTLATCGGLLGLSSFVWLMIAVWRSLGKTMRQTPENFSEEQYGQRAIPPLRGARGVFFETEEIFKALRHFSRNAISFRLFTASKNRDAATPPCPPQGGSIQASSANRNLVFACRAAMISFLVTGLFDWTFGDAEVVTMFWFIIGLGMGQANSQTNESGAKMEEREQRWRKAQVYEKKWWEGRVEALNLGYYQAYADELRRELVGFIEINKQTAVLEIGSGPAGILTHLDCERKCAIDPLENFYAAVPKFAGFRDRRVRYYAGQAEDLPFDEAEFDLVINDNVLDHCESPQRVVQEMYRALKPAGRVYFRMVTYHAWGKFVRVLLEKFQIDHGHPYTFSKSDLASAFQQAGFRILKTNSKGYLKSWLADLGSGSWKGIAKALLFATRDKTLYVLGK